MSKLHDDYKPTDAEIAYRKRLAEEIKKLPKKPASNMQQMSTLSTLNRDPKDDEAHFNRPIADGWKPPHWVEDPTPDQIGELIGIRHFDPKQIEVILDIRRKGRNSMGDFMSEGLSSVSKESKEHAMSAFTCSPPAVLSPEEKEKLMKMSGYTPPPPPLEEPKKSLFERFKEALKPQKVEIDKDSVAYALYKISGGKDEDFK